MERGRSFLAGDATNYYLVGEPRKVRDHYIARLSSMLNLRRNLLENPPSPPSTSIHLTTTATQSTASLICYTAFSQAQTTPVQTFPQ